MKAALAACLLLFAGAAAPTQSQAPAPRAGLPMPAMPVPEVRPGPTIPLAITTARGVRRYRVEVAATPAEQEQGLMFRRAMPRDHGMIFPMAPARPASFWMKNTYLPLDILFIGPDRRIISIAASARPLSLDFIECPQPVAAVLELNAGEAALRRLRPGDRVRW